MIDYSYILKEHIPHAGSDIIIRLLAKYEVQLRVTKKRISKLGDYNPKTNKTPHKISINGNLNRYAFLIILLHELAHLMNYIKYGRKVNPHGAEWKEEFRSLSSGFLELRVFPENIHSAFVKYMDNPKAVTYSHRELKIALNYYDKDSNTHFLETLPTDAVFRLNNKVFRKGHIIRKRYKCTEIPSGKKYVISPLAPVKIVDK